MQNIVVFCINTHKSLQKCSWLKYGVSGPSREERGGGEGRKRGAGRNISPLPPTTGEYLGPILGC